jgi:hypothetical protein
VILDNRGVTLESTRREQLRRRIEDVLARRLSPEGIRAATMTERLTVCRLSWIWVVRLNRYLAFVGKIATGVWCAFIASIVLGFDWRDTVRSVFNSGDPVNGALLLAIVVPTAIFLLARSSIGYCRWRLQRELWRRDVERLREVNRSDRGDEP